MQCFRVAGPTFVTLVAAIFTGGVFIFPTFHLYLPAAVCGVGAAAAILYWFWTGTARIPDQAEKNVGLGLTLPLYASGPSSVGWWGMYITMIGDATAFASLVFGYFFFWTVRDDFPPGPDAGPGLLWPTIAFVALLTAWALTLLARRRNTGGSAAALRACLLAGAVCTLLGTAALLAGPWATGLDPTTHSYPATVWVIAGWTAVHAVVGLVMQLYCVARSLAGRLTPTHDIDIWNVTLYWHFLAVTVAVTYATLALFPRVT